MYAEHLVYRFENLLGRTMWEFSAMADEPMFLIIGRPDGDRPGTPESLPAALRERLILYGTLTPLDGGPAGVALIVQAQDRDAARALLAEAQPAAEGFPDVEIHDWEFGGRR